MTSTVFILGTSHPLQCGAAECGDDRISLLKQVILGALSDHGIRRIAEEMSHDGLRERLGDEAENGTICQRIAPKDISVQFVDLGMKERACLSLSDTNIITSSIKHAEENSEIAKFRESLNFLCGEVRERVWVARVLSGEGWPVLFVCGADHAVSVKRLFERVGVQATVICGDFDPE